MRVRHVLASIAALYVVSLAAPDARAQNAGFNVNRFDPSERGSHWFVMESLDFRGDARPAFGIVGDYQYRPLAIYDKNGDLRTAPVRHMATMNVGAAIVLAETIRFAVNMPIVPYAEGQQGSLDGITYNPPASTSGVGDLRFGMDVKLFGQGEGPVSAAIGAQAWIPTGDRASYTSDRTFRGAPRLLIAGSPGIFTYAIKTGVMIRGEDARPFAGSPIGHEWLFGGAVGLRVADRRLVFGPEVWGSTVLTDQTFKTRTTPVEGLMGVHYTFKGGLRIGGGAGAGLTRGYGAPASRFVADIEWMPDVVEDKDGDGIPDAEDACPEEKGVRSADPTKNGCPAPKAVKPADRDNDGILDQDDACPEVPGVKTGDPKTNGCADKDGDGVFDPVDACVDVPGIKSDDPKLNGCPENDRDKDGVPNAEDACPDVAGIKTSDPKTNGCPDTDRDKDGIANDQDACPDEPGKPDPDPKRNGCPKAFVAHGQIKILDQVKFKVGSAQILPGKDSEEVLQAVAKVLVDHPEITKVRIEGHTDNTGSPKLNKKLSGDRAASVVGWLVAHGVAKDRLTSEGFGPERPIDTNTTEEGRRNNRRVEFHIESSTPKP